MWWDLDKVTIVYNEIETVLKVHAGEKFPKPSATLVKTRAHDLVETELTRLSTMPIVELRKRYYEAFKQAPPVAFGPDLLRRSIAYHLQERVHGGLSAGIRNELLAVAKSAGLGVVGKLPIPRKIKSGSVLVREWKGAVHHVVVMDGGLLYAGKKYATLSEIAREITGTRWNGPRFFGLRPRDSETADTKSAKAKRK